MAAHRGHSEAVDYLLSVVPRAELRGYINFCSSSPPLTALYLAAQAGYMNIVSSLLSAGANINQPLEGNQVPLHIAALNGHLEIVKLLIEKGADVNYQSLSGATPLFCAAAEGHREVCEYLLAANADPALGSYYEENLFEQRTTAEEVARDSGHIALADYIANYPY